MKKIEFFKVEGNSISRFRKHCPKCGPGIFLAEHKDRFSCGNCGYTEFKSGGKKEQIKPEPMEKPVEEPKTPETSQEPEKPEINSEDSKDSVEPEEKQGKEELSEEDQNKTEESGEDPKKRSD